MSENQLHRRNTPSWMLRHRSIVAGAAILALAGLTACSSSGGDSGAATTPSAGGSNTGSSSAQATGDAEQSVAAALAASCGGSESDWATLIAAAQKEGKVVVAGPPNPKVNKDLPEAFKKQFGISVDYLAGSSGATAQKIKSERQAGINSLDIFFSGGNTMSTLIYKSGWLDDLKSQLISPKVTDPSIWEGGAQGAPFVDEPTFNSVAKISADMQLQFIYNTDLVKDGEIKGWHDLLDPKWTGKIAAMDPSKGAGLSFNVAIMLDSKLGADFLSQLYKGQKVVLQTSDRQAADAVAKGQYAVAIGISEANGQIDQLIADGLPIKAMTHPDDAPQMVSAGYGMFGVMKPAPHPAAAKLFANWLLCPDGNKAWNEPNRYVSLRKDVHLDVPDFLQPDLSASYWDTYDWKLLTSDTAEQVLQKLNQLLK